MAKVNKKLTPAQKRAKKAAKAERQKKYQWVFMNGKQVRITRPPTVDGVPVNQFIEENADPLWLHQNEMWELMPERHFGSRHLGSGRVSCILLEKKPAEGEGIGPRLVL